jgi:formylglycine-generating enzyme required for sulfatase activity
MPHWNRSARSHAAAVLAATATASAFAGGVVIELVTVGDPGNDPDTRLQESGVIQCGAVAYEFRMGRHHVTIGQYAAFLNAVARSDPHGLYSPQMATNLNIAGIARSGVPGKHAYTVMENGGDSSNRPITYVSWFDCARFANWLSNGQPSGAASATTTEDGAYTLLGRTTGAAVGRNEVNPNTGATPTFHIPTADEWYKAAFYSPNKAGSGVPGYHTYATQSDVRPGNAIGPLPNQANYRANEVYAVTGVTTFDPAQNYLTDVGAFSGSPSHYGTFDQSGNAYQWNDMECAPTLLRERRGGTFEGVFTGSSISYWHSSTWAPDFQSYKIGFRLAAPAAPPCPEDISGDGQIGGADLAMLLGAWGAVGGRGSRGDLDADGIVGGADLALLLGRWGACPH